MASRAFVVGVALAALIDPIAALLAQDGGASPSTGHRMQLVRAGDGTPIGGAEVFDLVFDPDGGVGWTSRLRENPEDEMPKIARRCVADGDGWVELAPGRLHTLLARAPGRYRFVELADFLRDPIGKLGLLDDSPLVIEIFDAHGAPVEGAIVERGKMMFCGAGVRHNEPWRKTTDRHGRLSFPHYLSWLCENEYSIGDWLELQTPVNDPPRIGLGSPSLRPRFDVLEEMPRLVRWQLPPLSKIHVEFVGADAVPPDRAITFEMVGPKQYFGVPDRYASDHGEPVELLTEIGVELRACFHWRERDPKQRREPDLRVFGSAHPVEGGCALLRVPVASDPIAVRLRPVRGDGATFPSAATAGAKVRKFDVSFQWFDRAGFRFVRNVCGVAPDETGTLRFSWPRPRFDAAERPAKLRVALRSEAHLYGWEPLEPDDLVVREVDWPLGEAVDVGTLVVPGAG